MAKERIIWSNIDINYDEWETDYQEYLEINNMSEDDCSLYEWVNESLDIYFDDERCNLSKKVNGYIVAFADLGLWNGRANGAKIVGDNVNQILDCSCGDYVKWYCDRYNVNCVDAHHDGTNRYIFRVAKSYEDAKRLVNKIAYEGMTREQFMKATKSLRPYIAEVYGW